MKKELQFKSPFQLLSVMMIALTFLCSSNLSANEATLPAFACTAGATEIEGNVFEDYNYDGNGDAGEPGFGGITVTATDALNTAFTATTASDGTYTISGLTAGADYRVEFTNIPAWASPTADGVDNGTTVQFIQAGNCANLGISAPVSYSEDDPVLMINRFVIEAFNDPLFNTEPTILGLNYSFAADVDGNINGTTYQGAGNPSPPVHTPAKPATNPIATHADIGSTWGLAYAKDPKDLYLASYVKAGGSLGPGESTGMIFKINDPLGANTLTPYVDLNVVFGANTAGVNPHPTATSTYNWLEDSATNAVIGKVGLGDMDISNDEAFLYVINLEDRRLYKIPTSGALTAATITRYDIPTAALPTVTDAGGTPGVCPPADMRPFGLAVHKDGSIYVGAVCSCESISAGYNAQPNNASYQMTAYVWRFDGTNFTLVLDESLRFDRDNDGGYTTGDDFVNGGLRNQDWEPWSDLSDPLIHAQPNPSQNEPMLSDILFDDTGGMILAFRDRSGDCVTLYGGNRTSGDIYKACKNGAGVWTMESNATCGSNTTGGVGNNEGPGGGEFFFEDLQGDGWVNSGCGGVFSLPGRNEIVMTATDAVYIDSDGNQFFNLRAAGIQIFDSETGTIEGAYNVYEDGANADFLKASGIGGIESLSEPAPLEIGNLVWSDTNSNGVQDAGEAGIAGVDVELRAGGVLISTATTDASGNYIFSSAASGAGAAPSHIYGLAALVPGTAYTLTVPTTNGGNNLSTASAGANIIIDSDADMVTGVAAVLVTDVPLWGTNNHNFDFGYGAPPCPPVRCGIITGIKN